MPQITLLAISLFVFIHAPIIMKDAKINTSSNVTETVDPIVTGQTFSDEHMDEWKEQREKYIDCADCAIEPQPYPGDED